MSVCWILLVLLGFGSSHAIKCLSTCACNDQVKIACAADGDRVSVPCPFSDVQEMHFTLFMGKEKIASYIFDNQNNSRQTKQLLNVIKGVDLYVNATERSFNFVLAARSGNYSCETKNTFPPPIRSMHNAAMILVLMQGHECNCSADSDPFIQHEVKTHEPPLWIWILGFAAVSVYGVIVTIIACVNWLKLKTSESNSDYMNTKPRAPKGHRKRGVQHPVPRHF